MTIRVLLKQYCKEYYGSKFPCIMVHSDDGWLCVLHKHWKYRDPVKEAPRVYIGGKYKILTETKYPHSIYISTWHE